MRNRCGTAWNRAATVVAYWKTSFQVTCSRQGSIIFRAIAASTPLFCARGWRAAGIILTREISPQKVIRFEQTGSQCRSDKFSY